MTTSTSTVSTSKKYTLPVVVEVELDLTPSQHAEITANLATKGWELGDYLYMSSIGSIRLEDDSDVEMEITNYAWPANGAQLRAVAE
jgi:hypothetical protein